MLISDPLLAIPPKEISKETPDEYRARRGLAKETPDQYRARHAKMDAAAASAKIQEMPAPRREGETDGEYRERRKQGNIARQEEKKRKKAEEEARKKAKEDAKEEAAYKPFCDEKR